MFAWAKRQIIYIKNKTNKNEKIMLSYYISDNRHPTKLGSVGIPKNVTHQRNNLLFGMKKLIN